MTTDLLVYYVGDENPSITDVATIDGVPDDLTGKTARFKMRAVNSSTVLVDQAVSNTLDATGVLRYDWGTTDLDTAGFYLVWWEIKTGSKPATVGEAIIEVRQHAPIANAYLELEEMRQFLSMSGTYADPSMRRAILAASRAIDGMCNRRFWQDTDATQVRYYTPRSDRLVVTDDLVTVTSVQVDQDGDGTFEETWVVNTEYHAEPVNAAADGVPFTRLTAAEYGGKSWPARTRAVKVTGKFGWPAVPAAIIQATSILASRLQKRERETPFAVASVGIDGSAVRIARVDPDVAELVSPYIVYTVA